MKKNITKKYIKDGIFMVGGFLLIYGVVWSCTNLFSFHKVDNPKDILITNSAGNGIELAVEFKKGKAHNNPLMAIWIEDTLGNFIQTLYVPKSIGSGVFEHGIASQGKWKPGQVRRSAALPYWGHRRGIQAEDGLYIPTRENPVPDAITGPTPLNDFRLETKTNNKNLRQFRILFEINQTWDWNEYWTYNKFPDDEEYQTSCQPALVYSAEIDLNQPKVKYVMEPIGHSHYSGKNGNLYTDLGTITTALEITEEIVVILK
ncbi:MAG: hypothetical protein KAU83_00465 [Bacteroidales bacterium]|nr:hypothetical protein [Bacteroidales bacterium]